MMTKSLQNIFLLIVVSASRLFQASCEEPMCACSQTEIKLEVNITEPCGGTSLMPEQTTSIGEYVCAAINLPSPANEEIVEILMSEFDKKI